MVCTISVSELSAPPPPKNQLYPGQWRVHCSYIHSLHETHLYYCATKSYRNSHYVSSSFILISSFQMYGRSSKYSDYATDSHSGTFGSYPGGVKRFLSSPKGLDCGLGERGLSPGSKPSKA
jgi:hypothetical protein